MTASPSVIAADDGGAAPDPLRVEQVTSEGALMSLQVRPTDADRGRVGRELRMRLEDRCVAEGLRTRLPRPGTAAGAPAGVR
ncbi:hypothetical protein E4P41_18225 [Geodermatophilus sp. DF01-2]|uniref:hypothetical protein n=1 Tax=Geodermatophilus sp. DF01-2 TaxID=2559610 RepID=UPI001074035F|nr:hypothetical protein [Geodermatophilus sp. DF01_2]TFV54828.1 hypothetical protein E4P41_18225 [Geodermatophilus sp. DF01_2]